MDPQQVFNAPKERRYLILAVMAGLVVLAGVWMGLFWKRSVPQGQETGQQAIITEITLAGLSTPQQEGQANPALKQKPSYQVGEPLALRVTTADDVHELTQISVRLLDKQGGIHELSTSSVSFQPGTSTFCCWHIAKKGDYTLQIFRPERTVTTLPVKIH